MPKVVEMGLKIIAKRVRRRAPLIVDGSFETPPENTQASNIVRLLIGHTSDNGIAPESHSARGLITNSERYFDDIQSHLVALIGLAHMIEVGSSGKSAIYGPGHTVRLDCATEAASWYWSPHTTVQQLASNFVPTNLVIERIAQTPALGAGALNLGALGNLLKGFGQALITNYFERHRHDIVDKFGTDVNSSWPSVWNFARVVRNAMAHGGEILIRSPTAPPVNWKGLSYSPNDNGRNILHTDLWPGDLLDLLIEMDSHLS